MAQRATLIAQFLGDDTGFQQAAKRVSGAAQQATKAQQLAQKAAEAQLRATDASLRGAEGIAKRWQAVADSLSRAAKEQSRIAAAAVQIRKETGATADHALRLAQIQVRQANQLQRKHAGQEALTGRELMPAAARPYGAPGSYRPGVPAGGLGPGGRRRGGDLQTAYYIGQDLAQGGPMAIANQVPQIIDLVKHYGPTVLRAAGPYLIAATAVAIAGHAAWKMITKEIAERDEINKGLKDRFDTVQKDRLEKAALRGKSLEETNRETARLDEINQAHRESENDARLTQMELRQERERIAAESIQDERERLRTLAEIEKKSLRERAEFEMEVAKEVSERTAKEAQKAWEAFDEATREMEKLEEIERKSKQDTGFRERPLTDAENDRLAELRAGIGERKEEWERRKRFSEDSGVGLLRAESRLNSEVPTRQGNIDAETANRIAEAEMNQGKKTLDSFFDAIMNGSRKIVEAGKRWEDFREKEEKRLEREAKSRRRFDRQIEELEGEASGMSPRRMKKIRRENRIERLTEEYEEEYGDKAEEMARRTVNAEDDIEERQSGRRRIRGAGRRRKDDPNPEPFGLNNPGFRLLGSATFDRLADRKPGADNGGLFPGLERLKQLQDEPPRIRGAGRKGPDPKRDDEGATPADKTAAAIAAGSQAGPIGALLAPLAVIATNIQEIRNQIGVRPLNNN